MKNMEYLDKTLNGLIIGLAIALVFVLASCSKDDTLEVEECLPVVSAQRFFNIQGNYSYVLTLKDNTSAFSGSRAAVAVGTLFCPQPCFYEYTIKIETFENGILIKTVNDKRYDLAGVKVIGDIVGTTLISSGGGVEKKIIGTIIIKNKICR